MFTAGIIELNRCLSVELAVRYVFCWDHRFEPLPERGIGKNTGVLRFGLKRALNYRRNTE